MLFLMCVVSGIGCDTTPASGAPTPTLSIPLSTETPSDGLAVVELSPSATPTPVPYIKPEPHVLYIDRSHLGKATASIEERIFLSDVVVKARLTSASDGNLRFNAIQYLKGTGPTRFIVKASTEGRDTQWDNQDAILFLERLTGETEDFKFIETTSWDYWEEPGSPEYQSNPSIASTYTGDLPEGYTVETRNPVWLPVATSSSASGGESRGSSSQGNGKSESPIGPDSIITEYSDGAPQNITLEKLQQTIQWATPPVSGGASGGGVGSGRLSSNSASAPFPKASPTEYTTEEYTNCLRSAVDWIRWERDIEAHADPNHELKQPVQQEHHVESGIPVRLFRHYTNNIGTTEDGSFSDDPRWTQWYDKNWLTGADADLFEARIDDDDNDARTGHFDEIVARRPLPSGTYRFRFWNQPYGWYICDFIPDNYGDFTIVATAPEGTVHEAFFDPATTTSGVGYLAGSATTTGVLEPAGFSMRGRDINLTGLEWRNGQVVLSFDRTVQLSDGLSFIETDGTAGLYLSQYDATEDLRARTVTWEVSEQPWESGDELMLRIGPIPLPGVRNLTAERGSGREVVLRWEVEYTAGVNGYRIWRHQPGRDEGPRIYVSDTLSTDTTFTDANSPVPNLTEYRVQAIDRVYNAGESSESVRIGSQ